MAPIELGQAYDNKMGCVVWCHLICLIFFVFAQTQIKLQIWLKIQLQLQLQIQIQSWIDIRNIIAAVE